ncbi:hypothetical protein PAAG_08590 [Paracoccidioides lutzii Pb01]|uniref:Inner kinetochore subunit AME1 domain-containing protein n=1 Tax=Paracoccidioides lutzii (strain ATCC MYA-826 / Pb01) TaxID=502779 RepID=C1HCU9_PARBA|nr:hypothetical protein PAAG_08590 [Paracoccidioides lutzii Pb01]EEH39321.1 hypothetical protein PAAG_08590 [Paracoccidioides lutzii Pb01]
MASNREERRLMRQRGAGNRIAKDVDFGFGFSFSTPKLQRPTPPASTALPEPNISPPKRSSSRMSTTPNQRRLTSPHLTRRTPTRSQNPSSSRNIQGSVRNSSPRKPSVFDIPPDDEPDQGRENKRRRLAAFEPISEDAVLSRMSVHGNGITTTGTSAQPVPDVPLRPDTVPREPGQGESGNGTREPSAQRDAGKHESHRALEDEVETLTRKPSGLTTSVLQEGRSQPFKPSPQRKRKKRKSVVQGPKKPKRSSVTVSQLRQETLQEPEPEPEPPLVSGSGPDIEQESEQGLEHAPAHEPEQEPETELQNNDVESRDVDEPTEGFTRPPKRKPKKRKYIPKMPTKHERRVPLFHNETEEQQIEEHNHGSEELNVNHAERGNEVENRGNEEHSHEHSTSPQPTTKSKRIPGRSAKGPRQQSQQQEDHEDAEENADVDRAQSRPSKKKQRKIWRPAEEENTGADGEPISRGETVPIIVHRFASLSALQCISGDVEDPSIEATQPDDQSVGQKYPSRSEVNPADVLGQISREILEKTISTLENGIAQESNAPRRAEWMRKRKAVELFGIELEQRLFEMSELLDSNFVLSARLKKQKKDMAYLRNRLVELRKERGKVALRIDEVRRKCIEDERIKTEHDNLNNSLYDLQLAIDRGGKFDDEQIVDPAVGLDFLLRTVAQDVSSAASGSHGGILNQIRHFNSQLERTAALLE